MASATIQVSQNKFDEIKKYYQKYEIKTPPHAFFAAKTPDCRITIYNSGKVLFQGNNIEKEVDKWGKEQDTKKNTSTNHLPDNFYYLNVIGSDEVGNGSYFGPLVVCSTFVTKKDISLLTELGVKDSKMLTDEKMRKIAPKLKEILPHKLLVVTPEKYNEVQPLYNAVKMKAVLHNQGISLLEKELTSTKVDAILIDEFTSLNNYQKYIKDEKLHTTATLYTITKGEQYHLAVAAASIIARVAFLDWLDAASNKLGIKLPSGAGHNVDIVAANLINKYSKDILKKVAKLHFANTKKALDLA